MDIEIEKYFGGIDISLEKLKKVMPRFNVDGTRYQIENWLKECAVFDKLIPNKSPVWIPYNSVLDYGIVLEVVWDKYLFKNYTIFENTEMCDWWISVPYCKVQHNDDVYRVYEISFYKKWKRKSQMLHLSAQEEKPKRKFFNSKEIAEFKKDEAILNSRNKRNK